MNNKKIKKYQTIMNLIKNTAITITTIGIAFYTIVQLINHESPLEKSPGIASDIASPVTYKTNKNGDIIIGELFFNESIGEYTDSIVWDSSEAKNN